MGQVDLQGKTLMPSFIDAHRHIVMLAQYTAFANLGKCTDFQQVTETIKEGKTLYRKEEQ
jgi:predicted amidohydrolase YtcJ